MTAPLLFTTPYGRPAAALLRARVAAAKADDPLHPVTVLVPTNSVGVSSRRMLATGALGPVTASGVGVAGLALLPVYRLAELLGAPALAAQGRRPVSTPLLGAAVRRALAEAPGVFAAVAEHPSTEEELVRAHRELSEVGEATLETLAAQGRRAHDVVAVHRAVRRAIVADWYEEADLMASAERSVIAGSSVLDDLGTVIVHLPQDLSHPAAGLLRAVAGATAVEVIAGVTGEAAADGDVARTVRRLGLRLPDATSPPAVSDETSPSPPRIDRVVSVSDAEEEVRTAVDEIVAAARAGTPLERMAVLYPHEHPYARIVHEHLAAADVMANGAAVRPLADRLVGRWLLDLLQLPQRDYDRPAVLGLLTSAPAVGASGHPVPAGTWERISRDAGVVRGRDEWTTRLTRYAEDQRRAAERTAEDAPPWRAERATRNAGYAERLQTFVGRIISELDTAGRMRRWNQLAAWCRRMTARYLARDRTAWPAVERDAADKVDRALDRLAGLTAIEPETRLAVFRRTLQLELDDDLGRVGELGHGVLVGTPSAALGVDLDLVVVLGLAEGVMPTRPREDSLLPDHERRSVADELRPRERSVDVEHRHLLAALASARRRVLVHPRGDLRRSLERAPSRWLPEDPGSDRSAASTPVRDEAGRGASRHVEVPSFAARVHGVAFPTTGQEYRLRALAGRTANGARLPAHPVVAGDDALRRGVELITGRRAGRFGRFTGRLPAHAADLVADAVRGRVTAPTALETWLSCPHRYLMEQVLRVKVVENPEELLTIDPRERGTVVHDVLERWLCELLDSDLPAPRQAWPPAARARLRELAEAACDDAEARGVTGHPLLWRRDRRRLLADLEQFPARDDDRRAERGLTPAATERPFGMSDDDPVLTVAVDGAPAVRLRGRIDRLDHTAAGGVVVVDYKTGSGYKERELTEERPLADGTRLQLPIYGLAVRDAYGATTDVHTEYWFVSGRGRWNRYGYPLTDAVVAQLSDALRIVTDGIEGGLFPMRPPTPGWSPFVECHYCDPDGLGTSDHYREWEQIRLDPALRAYVAQVEPDVLAETGSEAS